jgi:mono/diheme cytochrome c family protein
MQDFRFRLAVILIALIIFIPAICWAGDDAAILFKTKCAVCHGADGFANTPMGKKQSIPSFASDKVQKSSDADVQDFILNGGKEKKASHAFSGKGISAEDAKKLATFVKELGKKK